MRCVEQIIEFVCKLTKADVKEFDCIFVYRLVDPSLQVYYIVHRNKNYSTSAEIMNCKQVDDLISELSEEFELEWHDFEKVGGKTFMEWVEHLCLCVKGLDYSYKSVFESLEYLRKNYRWSIGSVISWFLASDSIYDNLLFEEKEILDEMMYDYIAEKAKEEES